MTFLYKADPQRGAEWARLFAEKAPELAFRVWPDVGAAEDVRYLAAWQPPGELMQTFPNLEIVFSVGAGIDQFDFSAIPEHIPVLRMIEPGIAAGMVEYVTLAVLAIHRDWGSYAQQQRERIWREHPLRPAQARRVGVLGLGVLGQAVLAQLRTLGFPCAGWSRSAHAIEGVACYSGNDGLAAFLAGTDILICLLPLTAATRGILDKTVFDRLPGGAALINVGRGGHLVQDDLLRALDDGRLSSAILDVCEPEPLPPDHPFWHHPRITLTPHIASITQPATAVDVAVSYTHLTLPTNREV